MLNHTPKCSRIKCCFRVYLKKIDHKSVLKHVLLSRVEAHMTLPSQLERN